MKLTHRQEEFILNILDLYRESQGPIHYSTLAERLGVSRFTAYDMLRVLYKKGFVTSEYHLSEGKSGPGRSERVFLPTELAHRLMDRITSDLSLDDWEMVKERVMDRIRLGEFSDLDIGDEMLVRVPPEGKGKLQYCVEVMTIIILHFRNSVRLPILTNHFQEILKGNHLPNRANLSLLGGFALGVLVQENPDDPIWQQELLEHVHRYQAIVVDLDNDECQQLVAHLENHLTKIFTILTPPTKS